jgi:hypothetical protein
LIEAILTVVALLFAAVPLGLLWWTVGGAVGALGGVIGVLGVLGLTVTAIRHVLRASDRHSATPWFLIASAVLAVALLGLRLWHIRDLAMPAWVDSLHHTLIAQQIAGEVRVPDGYGYLPGEPGPFIYHFGFHAWAGLLSRLTGAQPHRVVLVFGQVLNALACLVVYVPTRRLAENLPGQARDAAGLAAVGLAGAMIFPAYYVSWGRYTQLAGMVLLPAVMVATGRLTADDAQWHDVLVAGLLASGLALTHYRVFSYYALFVVAALLVAEFSAACGDRRRWVLKTAGVVGLTALLTLPWIVRLAPSFVRTTAAGRWTAQPGYNAFPWGYVRSYGWIVFALAGVGLVLSQGYEQRFAAALPVWGVLTTVALSIADTWLAHHRSWVIAWYVPLAAWGGYGAVGLWNLTTCRWKASSGAKRAVGAIVLLALLAVVAWRSPLVVNPATVFCSADDVTVLTQAAEHLPDDAVAFTATAQWFGWGMTRPADCGAWLAYAGVQTVPPPLAPSCRECAPQWNGEPTVSASPDEIVAAMASRGAEYAYVGTADGWKTLLDDVRFTVLFRRGRTALVRLRR